LHNNQPTTNTHLFEKVTTLASDLCPVHMQTNKKNQPTKRYNTKFIKLVPNQSLVKLVLANFGDYT